MKRSYYESPLADVVVINIEQICYISGGGTESVGQNDPMDDSDFDSN